jgi:hypothetical protein
LWNCIWSFSAGAAFFDATLTLLLLITFPALSFSIFSDEIARGLAEASRIFLDGIGFFSSRN